MSSLKIDKKSLDKDQQMYLKAIALKDLDQISKIKDEVSQNMIVILRITPIAQKNIKETILVNIIIDTLKVLNFVLYK